MTKGQTTCAIYARTSTKKNQDPRMQIKELREFSRRRGWKIAGEYVDHGSSGGKDSRPELDRLMRDCRKRLVECVLVYRYDRFARSLRFLVNALSEFDSLGIQFCSLHEGVDTTTPNGRLVFGIFASIAEFEKELIGERIRSGLEAAKAQGKQLGRPRHYMLGDKQVTRLKKDRLQGNLTLRQLARKYGISLWRTYLICSGKQARV